MAGNRTGIETAIAKKRGKATAWIDDRDWANFQDKLLDALNRSFARSYNADEIRALIKKNAENIYWRPGGAESSKYMKDLVVKVNSDKATGEVSIDAYSLVNYFRVLEKGVPDSQGKFVYVGNKPRNIQMRNRMRLWLEAKKGRPWSKKLDGDYVWVGKPDSQHKTHFPWGGRTVKYGEGYHIIEESLKGIVAGEGGGSMSLEAQLAAFERLEID